MTKKENKAKRKKKKEKKSKKRKRDRKKGKAKDDTQENRKHKRHRKKRRRQSSSNSSSSSNGDSSSGGGGGDVEVCKHPGHSSSYAPARPDRTQWKSSAAAAASSGPSAAAVLGISEDELARSAAERSRRFQSTHAEVSKRNSVADKTGPRVAHSGGKITHNKESAIHKFVIRLLRDGKQLTPAQLEAAEAAGVAVDRLRQVFGRTTDLG